MIMFFPGSLLPEKILGGYSVFWAFRIGQALKRPVDVSHLIGGILMKAQIKIIEILRQTISYKILCPGGIAW